MIVSRHRHRSRQLPAARITSTYLPSAQTAVYTPIGGNPGTSRYPLASRANEEKRLLPLPCQREGWLYATDFPLAIEYSTVFHSWPGQRSNRDNLDGERSAQSYASFDYPNRTCWAYPGPLQ